MANNNKIVASAGAAGVSITIAGASALGVTAGTIILATGAAAAVVLVGVGLLKWLSNKNDATTK